MSKLPHTRWLESRGTYGQIITSAARSDATTGARTERAAQIMEHEALTVPPTETVGDPRRWLKSC